MCNETHHSNSSSWLLVSHQHVKHSRQSGTRCSAGVKGGFVSGVSYFLDLTVLSMAYGHLRMMVVVSTNCWPLLSRTDCLIIAVSNWKRWRVEQLIQKQPAAESDMQPQYALACVCKRQIAAELSLFTYEKCSFTLDLIYQTYQSQ